MIARLSGTVLEKHPMRVVVDVGGVGYDVHVPLSSFSAIGEPGSTLALRVHTHVREDALMLFGFTSQTELTVFERLIAVSGIVLWRSLPAGHPGLRITPNADRSDFRENSEI